jgi:hypothetical protein
VGLRGKVCKPEQDECEVRPALAAQGEKGEEGKDARTNANH